MTTHLTRSADARPPTRPTRPSAAADRLHRRARSSSASTSSRTCSPTGRSTSRPWIDGIVPGTAQQAMYAVGVVEVLAGVLVAVAPRFGGWLVAAWLAGIILNLLTIPGFYDIALRDFGLLVGAVALARLAVRYAPGAAARGAGRVTAPGPGAGRADRPARLRVVREPRRGRPAGRRARGRRPAPGAGPGPGRAAPGRHPAPGRRRLRRAAHRRRRSTSPRSPTTRATTSWSWPRDIPVQSLCEHHLLPFTGRRAHRLPAGRPDPRAVQARPGARPVRPRPAGAGAADPAGRRLAAGEPRTRAASAW